MLSEGLRVRGGVVSLAGLRPLLGRILDAKRVRTPADGGNSLATLGFARAWTDLVAGVSPAEVALRETARAVVAVELGGIDAGVLQDAELDRDEIAALFDRALTIHAQVLGPDLTAKLRGVLPVLSEGRLQATYSAYFVGRLGRQPRAGATHPTKPRLILEPAESHADHCYSVAVIAVLLGEWAGDAEHGRAFLAGLSHHLHNAYLPDAGFAGEELLGTHLGPIMERFTAQAIKHLPDFLQDTVIEARTLLPAPDSPAAKAFHAADVLDRVLEMVHYDRVARFRVGQALDDLELVHAGPLRVFQNDVLLAAGVP